MVIIYNENTKSVQVVRNIEYRKWLSHISKLNESANANHNNPFEQDPVKWETFDFNTTDGRKDLDRFINTLNTMLNDKNLEKKTE